MAEINTLAQWFGSNRSTADAVSTLLGKLAWCGVPFMGGGPELLTIDTRAGVANDKHLHIINLAEVIARQPAALESALSASLFHPTCYTEAQRRCIYGYEGDEKRNSVEWAAAYFIVTWMGRGDQGGTPSEFKQSLSTRFTSSGGDSARRFHSAVESIPRWSAALKHWSFLCGDWSVFMEKHRDRPDHGLYCDPPWPELGALYQHAFPEAEHRRLASWLLSLTETRIVVRLNDHPLVRELYTEPQWQWFPQTTRNGSNNPVREVLLYRGPHV
jgi:site-specific DNA-adenine methylase